MPALTPLPVSTALWTGVYLVDILEYVRPRRGVAKHVIFEGGDSLPNGPYGTSQKLSWAANKERGMLIGKQFNTRRCQLKLKSQFQHGP